MIAAIAVLALAASASGVTPLARVDDQGSCSAGRRPARGPRWHRR